MKRRKQEVCINPKCPAKTSKEEQKEISKIEHHKVDRKCPKCGKELMVRSSVYGRFLGCSGFPKCRHTEKITQVASTGSAPSSTVILSKVEPEKKVETVLVKKVRKKNESS